MLPKFVIKILMPVMSKVTPTCEVVSQKVSESMDHQLSLSDRLRVRLHLMGCALCARYEKQLLAIRQILQEHLDEIESGENAPKLSDVAKSRIKQKLNEKSE